MIRFSYVISAFFILRGYKMRETDFWGNDVEKVVEIMNMCDELSFNAYTWVYNTKEQSAWCSEKTMKFFGFAEQISSNFEKEMAKHVFPYDLDEYNEEIRKRTNGEVLEEPFFVRVCGQDKRYAIFSFFSKPYFGKGNELEYVLFWMQNENIPSRFDPLTSLFSYTRYVEDLDIVLKTEERFAVLQIELVGFDTFHLLYGLDYSGELLKEIALSFIYMMNEKRCVYRLESERFVFILKEAGREELISFEKRVRQTLKDGVMVEGRLATINMDAGGILLERNQEDSSLIRGQVAYALEKSKKQKQGNLVIFNDEIATSRGVDFALMRAIHRSVLNACNGFYVEYQPIVTANTGKVVGAEALIRWAKEPYGVVPPGLFIEWMETESCMYDLGNFVLKTAVRELHSVLKTNPDFFINVNVSVRQLERREFHEDLLKILEDEKFPADHLCLELTERCRDFPLDKLRADVEFFQSHGIRVAMDDYGTGSASSSIVMNIPMDEIKIDMSFIRNIMDNPKNQDMVRSILYFARQSNMDTCLEGVETEELQNYLREFDATWFQGYYYAKPLLAKDLKSMVRVQR